MLISVKERSYEQVKNLSDVIYPKGQLILKITVYRSVKDLNELI